MSKTPFTEQYLNSIGLQDRGDGTFVKVKDKPIEIKFPSINHFVESGSATTVKILIKPLSVNEGYQGRRFKTPAHRIWHKAVIQSLPPLELPPPPYEVHYIFGLSSKLSDGDNCIKFLQDILAQKYKFNDRKIKRWIIDVDNVPKGYEYFSFKILTKQ